MRGDVALLLALLLAAKGQVEAAWTVKALARLLAAARLANVQRRIARLSL